MKNIKVHRILDFFATKVSLFFWVGVVYSSLCYADANSIYTCRARSWYSGGQRQRMDACQSADGVFCDLICYQYPDVFAARVKVSDSNLTASFKLSANGIYYVDWGDDTTERITRSATSMTLDTYTHTYAKAGIYTIKIANNENSDNGGGNEPTANYAYSSSLPVISFANNQQLIQILGSLGSVFPVRTAYLSFNNENNVTFDVIPLFTGAFSGCSNLKGALPYNLFVGIEGSRTNAPFADNMLKEMFKNSNIGADDCGVATYYIPDGFFNRFEESNISATDYMKDIFLGTKLVTSCPSNTYSTSSPFSSYWNTTSSATPVVAMCNRYSSSYQIQYNNRGSYETSYYTPSDTFGSLNGLALSESTYSLLCREFGGWVNTSCSSTADPIKYLAPGTFGNKSFSAYWIDLADSSQSHTINYKCYETDSSPVQTASYSETASFVPYDGAACTPPENKFVSGWTCQSDDATKGIDTSSSVRYCDSFGKSDTSCIAQYSDLYTNVTIDFEVPEIVPQYIDSPRGCDANGTYTLPTNEIVYMKDLVTVTNGDLTLLGWTLNGTYIGGAGQTIPCSTFNYEQNVTISAVWVGDITLNWDNGGHGAAASGPASCSYGSAFTMPAALTSSGWTFNKWNVNNNTFNANQSIECNYENLGVYDGSVTITADWNANIIDLIWNPNNGENSTSNACVYETGVSENPNDPYVHVPPVQNPVGYTFIGWEINNSGQNN